MGQSVLLIEDEPNISEAIRFLLTREGLEVSTHANGVDAIEAILRVQPDLLILDVMLPGRSGYEIMHELRGRADLINLPVMMVTARGQTRDRKLADAAGVDVFVSKPFANGDLLAAVRSLIAS